MGWRACAGRLWPSGISWKSGSYIAKDSPSAADRFLDLIGEKCDLLAASPELGRRREELAPSLRSFPVGRYVIFYRPGERGIQVVRVLSAYRDLAARFGPP